LTPDSPRPRRREDFRVNNFMAWHVKRDREASIAEARRELIWRGFLLPWFTAPFLGESAGGDSSRRGSRRSCEAFLAKSPRIEGVPEAMSPPL
jgi:hypothetical protein